MRAVLEAFLGLTVVAAVYGALVMVGGMVATLFGRATEKAEPVLLTYPVLGALAAIVAAGVGALALIVGEAVLDKALDR